MNKLINILITDDQPVFRKGLAGLLKECTGIGSIQLAANGFESIAIAEKQDIDVILMDIQMPGMDGFEATKIIHHTFPEIKIIALSIRDDQSSILEICSCGASGYLIKNTSLEEVLEAIHTVMKGGKYFSMEISKIMVNGFMESTTGIMPYHLKDAITGRERQVLALLCAGLTADEIGVKLGIPKKTVESIKAKLYLKTGTMNAGGLIGFAFRNKLIH